jgi:protein tyrosine phosphatase
MSKTITETLDTLRTTNSLPVLLAPLLNNLNLLLTNNFHLLRDLELKRRNTANYQMNTALLLANKKKNRYQDILPFDENRVKLDTGDNDYINASFCHQLDKNNTTIATQGPLPDALIDFWQMLVEQKSKIIVMLTNEDEKGRVKCCRYWPSDYTPMKLTKIFSTGKLEIDIHLLRDSVCLGHEGRITRRKFKITWRIYEEDLADCFSEMELLDNNDSAQLNKIK